MGPAVLGHASGAPRDAAANGGVLKGTTELLGITLLAPRAERAPSRAGKHLRDLPDELSFFFSAERSLVTNNFRVASQT